MTTEEKNKFDQYFLWELMRLGVLASDSRVMFDIHPNRIRREAWLIAQAKLEQTQEVERVLHKLLSDNPS